MNIWKRNMQKLWDTLLMSGIYLLGKWASFEDGGGGWITMWMYLMRLNGILKNG